MAEAAEGEVIVVEADGTPLVEIAAAKKTSKVEDPKTAWSFLDPAALAEIEKLRVTDSDRAINQIRS